MSRELSSEQTHQYRQEFEADPQRKVLQNVISSNDVTKLITSRDVDSQDNFFFDVTVKPKLPVTNQKSSGRCWLFAALNVIRRGMIAKYDLSPSFEMSQSYLFFWDKYERVNYSLETLISTRNEPLDGRLVQFILHDPICDGGQWDMIVNILNKYGAVPQSCYNESFNSSNTGSLNTILVRKIRECAVSIRNASSEEGAREIKNNFMKWTYETLCLLLGTPPTTINWKFYDSKNNYHELEPMSPVEFFKYHVPFNPNDYVCLINDPRQEHPYFTRYTVQYLGNVIEGYPVRYLNVPISEMKKAVILSLTNNEAVWMGCDVGKQRLNNQMNLDINKSAELFGTTYGMTKEERLKYGESQMTHAMTFTGYNTKHQSFQVENSWGKNEPADGYMMMTDSWFNEFMYEVVVHKNYITTEIKQALELPDSTVLDPWDPMGALAF